MKHTEEQADWFDIDQNPKEDTLMSDEKVLDNYMVPAIPIDMSKYFEEEQESGSSL